MLVPQIKSQVFYILSRGEKYEFQIWTDVDLPWQEMLLSMIEKIQQVSEEIGIPLSQRGCINIRFLELDDCLGRYITDSDEIHINRDQHGMEIEPTLFHEVLHYFYDDLFQFDVHGPYLTEGFAIYYEQQYYPKSEFWLLQYWLTKKYLFHAIGYVMFQDYSDEVILALKSESPTDILKELIPSITKYEKQTLMHHLARNFLTICIVDGYSELFWGIIYSMDMECPYLVRLSHTDITNLLKDYPELKIHQTLKSDMDIFLQGTQEKVIACAEDGWEKMAKIIAQYAERIQEKYHFIGSK